MRGYISDIKSSSIIDLKLLISSLRVLILVYQNRNATVATLLLNIYIYIYVYILSSTDRLFHSIRTLQCGQTRRTLETHPTLLQTKCQTVRPTNLSRLAKGIFKVLCCNSSSRLHTFLYPIGYLSAHLFRRALHYASSGRKFFHQCAHVICS